MTCFDDEKGRGRIERTIGPDKSEVPTLSQNNLKMLGKVGLKIERHFDFPQDIEWAYQNGDLYILQSRNIRTLTQ